MKKTAHRLSILILSIFLLILTGCDGIIPDSIYVELNKPYSVLLIGETDQLEARIVHSTATNQNVLWTSGDPGIATVSRTGLVTGVAAGTTLVSAALGPDGQPTVCEVTVAPMAHPTGVAIVPSTDVSLLVGKSFQYTATVSPSNVVNNKVTWSSSNPGSATITENGLAKAVANGWTLITATSEDGGFSAIARLDVISTEIPVTGIAGAGSSSLRDGITRMPFQLDFSIYPANATNKKVFWASTNPRIATVSQSGLVTPLRNGNVDIFIMTEDGAYTTSININIDTSPFDPLGTQAQ